MRDYSLQVISHLPRFKGQTLVPYFVDGIDTIGVWGDEPFELKFTNHTGNSVQVRLSVDGTDVLTAEQAHVEAHGKMFIVRPYQSMSLEAWPETTEAGARFMFGKTGASVALHTHGDLSNKGIIAAAVFVEGYVPPVRTTPSWSNRRSRGITKSSLIGGGGGGTYSSNSYGPAAAGGGVDGLSLGLMDFDRERLDESPAVGAGETIKQAIGKATGLVRPTFDRSVRCRYLWWDELQAKIGKYSSAQQHPSGFTSQPEQLANLKGTPRIERTRVEVAQRTM